MPTQKLLKPKRDLTGKIFNRLTVLGFSHYKQLKNRRADYWDVRCTCNNTKKVMGNSLVTSGVRSCGCLLKESYSTLGERTRKRNLLPEGESSFNNILSSYKDRAKRKSLKFSLTKDEFKALILGNCQYCGSEPKNILRKKKQNGFIVYNGVDRLDNSKGYIKENCVTACEICNKAKRDLNLEEYLSWIQKLTQSNSWKKLIKVQK